MSDETQPSSSPKEKFSTLFPDPVVKSKVMDILTSSKPLGAGRKSSYPYYKDSYAKEIQVEVDKMITNRSDIVFRFDSHCSSLDITERSLYLRINQSIRCLCDRHDPSGIYKEWYTCVRLTIVKGLGIRISFRPEFRHMLINTLKADEVMVEENVVEISTMPKWKRDMDEWLESGETNSFVREKLALTDKEVKDLRMQLDDLQDIEADVKSASIKIIRLA